MKFPDCLSIDSLVTIGKTYGIDVQINPEIIMMEPFDDGYFSFIYRLSRVRVLKVHRIPSDVSWYEILIDEIEGSMKLRGALPILKLLGVYIPREDRYGMLHVGLLRRYIPLRITKKDIQQVRKMGGPDCKKSNFRKDYSGKIYRVDTQVLSFLE